MIFLNRFIFLPIIFLISACSVLAQDTPVRYEFSGSTAEANKVTLQGAGFGQYPQAAVSFGEIPIDNTFDGATDGKGVIITAKPGEGVMIFAEKVATKYSAVIRCSVRTDKSNASITIATIGDEPDVFVSTNTPNNKGYFTGQYLRLQTSCTPPSTGFQPVIQVINTSKTESLSAYLDNFEIYMLDPNKYYSAAFLDGDQTDPPADKISVPSDGEPGAFPADLSIPLGNNVTLAMKLINKGTFKMGAYSDDTERIYNELPQHDVTISKSFYLGKYEVTQAQWEAVMGSNPSAWKGSNLPVENVSWDECQTFVKNLNLKGQGTFRLPTEAEWEYACRAATTTRFYWGADMSNTQITNNAWDGYNSGNITHEGGGKLSNPWGLYDMSGNLFEWCQDWYDDYTSGSQTDPVGATSGTFHVFRGGNWNSLHKDCRSARRYSHFPYFKSNGIGFRILKTTS